MRFEKRREADRFFDAASWSLFLHVRVGFLKKVLLLFIVYFLLEGAF